MPPGGDANLLEDIMNSKKMASANVLQRVCNEFDFNFRSPLDLYFEFDLEAMYCPYILMLFPK